jgi:hypothetical protein
LKKCGAAKVGRHLIAKDKSTQHSLSLANVSCVSNDSFVVGQYDLALSVQDGLGTL